MGWTCINCNHDSETCQCSAIVSFDPVSKPQHYVSGKIECIDALESATQNLIGLEAFCTANAIKYLWRWKQKNGVEDLQKAKWYIDRMIGEQK